MSEKQAYLPGGMDTPARAQHVKNASNVTCPVDLGSNSCVTSKDSTVSQ